MNGICSEFRSRAPKLKLLGQKPAHKWAILREIENDQIETPDSRADLEPE
jgi:hypothetical protein